MLFFLFTSINYTGHGAPGVHEECFSPLSSIFAPVSHPLLSPLPHFTQLQLPSPGDREWLANGSAVEMRDRARPGRSRVCSLGSPGVIAVDVSS